MRQKQTKEKPQMVSIKISNTLLDQFDAIIAKKGINRSEAIRAYMVEYIDKNTSFPETK